MAIQAAELCLSKAAGRTSQRDGAVNTALDLSVPRPHLCTDASTDVCQKARELVGHARRHERERRAHQDGPCPSSMAPDTAPSTAPDRHGGDCAGSGALASAQEWLTAQLTSSTRETAHTDAGDATPTTSPPTTPPRALLRARGVVMPPGPSAPTGGLEQTDATRLDPLTEVLHTASVMGLPPPPPPALQRAESVHCGSFNGSEQQVKGAEADAREAVCAQRLARVRGAKSESSVAVAHS